MEIRVKLAGTLLGIIMLAFAVVTTAAAGPFEDAIAAYDRGDYATAMRLLRPLADQGDSDSQYKLGFMYEWGLGVSQDSAEAVNWLRKAAEQGHANAQYNLGIMYDGGSPDIPQDKEEAARWHAEAVKGFRKAADQGEAQAQNDLGFMYEQGLGVSRDYTEAANWYRKAAEQGEIAAIHALGRMYKQGLGVEQNYAEAVKWYRKSADAGLSWGQYNLGLMYREGQGVPQSYVEAAKWFRKAADQADARAQNDLGIMYETGQGVAQNYAEAAKWYRKAAEAGRAIAQINLGAMYAYGRGVSQDYVLAHMWTNLAAARLNEKVTRDKALNNRNIVAAKMTPAQIEEAQRLAQACIQNSFKKCGSNRQHVVRGQDNQTMIEPEKRADRQNKGYVDSILNRPMPTNDDARRQECRWIRFEIARQQGVADILGGGISQAVARQHIAALESRAANVQCPAAFR